MWAVVETLLIASTGGLAVAVVNIWRDGRTRLHAAQQGQLEWTRRRLDSVDEALVQVSAKVDTYMLADDEEEPAALCALEAGQTKLVALAAVSTDAILMHALEEVDDACVALLRAKQKPEVGARAVDVDEAVRVASFRLDELAHGARPVLDDETAEVVNAMWRHEAGVSLRREFRQASHAMLVAMGRRANRYLGVEPEYARPFSPREDEPTQQPVDVATPRAGQPHASATSESGARARAGEPQSQRRSLDSCGEVRV